jgi:hypothetical protein
VRRVFHLHGLSFQGAWKMLIYTCQSSAAHAGAWPRRSRLSPFQDRKAWMPGLHPA